MCEAGGACIKYSGVVEVWRQGALTSSNTAMARLCACDSRERECVCVCVCVCVRVCDYLAVSLGLEGRQACRGRLPGVVS